MMNSALTYLWRMMSPARRRAFYLTVAVTFLGAVMELLTIGAVLPFLALVAAPVESEGGIAATVFTRIGLDNAHDRILFCAGLLIAIAILAAVVRILLNWVTLRFVLMLGHEIGRRMYDRMLRQPYSTYVMRNTSELLAGIDKVQTVVWSVIMPGIQALAAAFMAVSISIFLFIVDPFTAVVAAASMATTYVVAALAMRRRLNANGKALAAAATGRLQAVQEGLGGIRDILLEQSQEVFEEKFRKLDYEYRQAQVVNNYIQLTPRFVVEAAAIVLIAALTVHMSSQAGGVMAAIPVLGALAIGAQRVMPLLQQAYLGWSSYAGNQQVMLDVIGLLESPVVQHIPRDRTRAVKPFTHSIELDGVTFNYVEREGALKNVSLVIPKGHSVGFVGETGSGKSTLIDIVMGLLEPSSGCLRIDGEKVGNSNLAQWQGQIAHVPQTIFLADASIAENIAFGEHESEIDTTRVMAAAKTAKIDQFIDDLPQGYAAYVGERGVRLSGGQRQRIGIARALYKRASVIILDEATSALDGPTERAIMEGISQLADDVTILMIAHRTTTLENCDLIVRLANGQIVEVGTYDDVILSAAGD